MKTSEYSNNSSCGFNLWPGAVNKFSKIDAGIYVSGNAKYANPENDIVVTDRSISQPHPTHSDGEHATCVNSLEKNIIKLDCAINIFEKQPHFVDFWIPQGEVTLLAGHGGSGKSFIALSVAIHVALGLPFGNLNTTKADVLFFSAEDGAIVIRQRVARICHALNIDIARLDGRLHILDASDIDPALHREQRSFNKGVSSVFTETKLLNELAALVQKLDVGLVVLDNASDIYDDDEIKRARVRSFVRSVRSKLSRPRRSVLLLAHVNKASVNSSKGAPREDYSGSTAWHNSVRSRLSVTGDDVIRVDHLKANLGSKAPSVRLEWTGGTPLVVGTFTIAGIEEAKEKAIVRDAADKQVLVKMIQDFDKRGEHVTNSAQGSATVFRLLKGEKCFPENTDSHRLMRLFRELEFEGKIFRGTVKTPSRKNKEVFTCSPERLFATSVLQKE